MISHWNSDSEVMTVKFQVGGWLGREESEKEGKTKTWNTKKVSEGEAATLHIDAQSRLG